MRKNSVIYCIENLANGKKYVGSARRGLADRKYFHVLQLKSGKHHSVHLQRAWDKYGEESFRFYVLEKVGTIDDVGKDQLLAREQVWIDSLGVCDIQNGYNCVPKAGSNARAAFYKTAEFRKKMSSRGKKAKRHGRKISLEGRINQGRTQAKLTDEQVSEIKALLKTGETQSSIAKKFGVCQQTICNINRKRGVVYGGISQMDYKPSRVVARLTDADREHIRAMYAKGKTQMQISEATGVSQSAISAIVNRK